jgi:hypothetical protein
MNAKEVYEQKADPSMGVSIPAVKSGRGCDDTLTQAAGVSAVTKSPSPGGHAQVGATLKAVRIQSGYRHLDNMVQENQDIEPTY